MDKTIYSPRSLQLAKLLERLRHENGLTTTAVAKKLGRHHPYVLDYENGQRRLDVVQLMEVVWALGATLTAITDVLAKSPPPPDGSIPDVLPEFAVVGSWDSRYSAAERDAWYDEEWTRLCALLRAVRRGTDRPSGRSLLEQDVADRLGEPQSFVSKYENKKRRLDLVELEQIAVALDTALLPVVTAFERDARPYPHDE